MPARGGVSVKRLPVAVVVGTGELIGVVVVVIGVAVGARGRREVEPGDLAGRVVEPPVVGEGGGAVVVGQVGQAPGLVEDVVGGGHRLGADQVGENLALGEMLARVEYVVAACD